MPFPGEILRRSSFGRRPRLVLCAALCAFAARTAAAADPRIVTAVETRLPITLDGVLDDEAWISAEPATDFVQAEPHEGQAATERTTVRLLFDRDALYVGVRCDDGMASALIVNDIRKDFTPGEQDTFEVLLDTFADRRNGFVFATNPAGAKSDTQIANEGRDVNTSWDAVWSVATKVDANGWSAEMRIPFKTLRFERGEGRIWGANFSRRIRRKNEVDYWSPVPRVYNLFRAGLAGTLTGLGDVSQGHNLRIKPWVAGNSTRAVGGGEFDPASHAPALLRLGAVRDVVPAAARFSSARGGGRTAVDGPRRRHELLHGCRKEAFDSASADFQARTRAPTFGRCAPLCPSA